MTNGKTFDARVSKPFGFYDYACSIREPGVTLMLVKPSRSRWRVSRYPLGRILLRSGGAGGATISDGISQPRSFLFFLRNCDYAHAMSLNGAAVAIDDIAVVPPGKQFAVACRGPHEWISLSVTPEVLLDAGFSSTQLDALGAVASVIRVPHWEALQLVAAATHAMECAQIGSIAAQATQIPDIERTLLADLSAAVIRNGDSGTTATSPYQTRSLDDFVQKALEFIRAHDGESVYIEHLCQATDMAERSLLRAFHKLFGVGTKQYLKLRRLNRVHYALMSSGCDVATVTGVLAIYGIKECGRFAGAYKRLFGESPSETLKKARGASYVSYRSRVHTIASISSRE